MRFTTAIVAFAGFVHLTLAGSTSAGWTAEKVDHGLYGELLQQYVRDGAVDYAGLKRDEEKLNRYLRQLERTDTGELSRNEGLAFYINAYNAYTIHLILTGYPGIKSIKDLGSFWQSPWKNELVRLDGKVMSLDDLEHGIIRPRFQDPRIHFAVNCASRSCPPLLSVPYRGHGIDRQLDSVTCAFVNDDKYNFFDGKTLHVSKIFDWYGGDFKEGIVSFFMRYASEELKERLKRAGDQIEIQYLPYDWSLNGK